MQLKFCGFTREEDVLYADTLAVGFLGFIIVKSSQRYVTPEKAKELISLVKNAKTVLVCDLQDQEEIKNIHQFTGADFIQLHGTPNLELNRKLQMPIIQAFRGFPSTETLNEFLKVSQYLLFDKKVDQQINDFDALKTLPQNILDRSFLAGGIDQKKLPTFKAFALDIARGIESAPGKKEHQLMTYFSNQIT